MNCFNTFTSLTRHGDQRNYVLFMVTVNQTLVFSIDSIDQRDLTSNIFTSGKAFKFDQSDSSNANFPLVFGSTPDGLNHVTTGVKFYSYGTPGTAGAVTKLILSADFTGPLYYYSSSQPLMGYMGSN